MAVPGWYIIYDENYGVLYVGVAEDLNKRLNTKDGTRDNFANPKRLFDPERNFIKKFIILGIIRPKVICIREKDFLEISDIKTQRLSKLDRKNIEKFIRIFSSYILTKLMP